MTFSPSPVDVVLPCLDEAEALPVALAGLPAGWRAVVVDNGSTDGSGDVARSLGATVVDEPRRGFGAACAAGLRAATAPVVAFCDADGSLDLADLPRLVAAVTAGHAAGSGHPVLALGRRRPTRAGAWPAHARVANRLLARRLRRVTGSIPPLQNRTCAFLRIRLMQALIAMQEYSGSSWWRPW